MQIQMLSINGKKCLKNVEIPFCISDSSSTTILIGENGTGKTTVIEAILEILMSFDSPAVEKRIDYSYEIKYEYAQKQVVIKKVNDYYTVFVDGSYLCGSYAQVRSMMQEYRLFPKRIISFYSGTNNKLKPLIQRMDFVYQREYRQIMRGYFYVEENITHNEPPSIPIRKYSFCDEHMVPIYLCAVLAGHNSYEKRYLQEECHWGDILHIDMSINMEKIEQLFSRNRYERPFFVEDPHRLFDVTDYIDHRLSELLREGWQGSDGRKGYIDLTKLPYYELDSVSILEFFEILHDLFGAQYEVYVDIGGNAVKSEDLSEGQRQLVKVLGMLGICKNEDCLILLDEPDAHMNPQWKYGIKKLMDGCLLHAQNAQAIIATHDPLVINGVNKDFIRIFDTVNGETVVHIPTVDTVGMGIDGLLQSQYYGLESTLDIKTQELLEEKRNLLVKRKSDHLSHGEQLRLRYLSETLENMAFARNIPTDNYYDDFVAAVHEIYKNRPMVDLSPEQIEEKNKILREIAKGLIEV